MSRIGSTDYYAADVPEGYTQIVFSSYPLSNDDNLAGRGDSTGWETIPDYSDDELAENERLADTEQAEALIQRLTRTA